MKPEIKHTVLDRFLRYDFWASIFFLKSQHPDFKATYPKVVGTGFKNKEVQKKTVQKPAEEFIDINYPVSETLDMEGKTRSILGVKHGPMSEQMGLPNKRLARMLGLASYGKYRIEKAIVRIKTRQTS